MVGEFHGSIMPTVESHLVLFRFERLRAIGSFLSSLSRACLEGKFYYPIYVLSCCEVDI